MDLPSDRRVRLISVAAAAVLVVLLGATLAAWLNTSPDQPPGRGNAPDPYGLQTGGQGGSSAPPAAAARLATASPPGAMVRVATQTTASYKTIALLGLGGFDTEVTVTNPGKSGWKVVLTLPEDKPAENRTPGTVKMDQQGTMVTLTPVTPSAEMVSFTVRFPALLALGKSVTACTIDGRPCTGA